MYAIVAIAHFYGPSVSAPEILDCGFKTAKEAWTALKSKDRSQTLSHNQYNTTYYIIDEDDFVKVVAPVFYRRLEAVDGRVDGPLTLTIASPERRQLCGRVLLVTLCEARRCADGTWVHEADECIRNSPGQKKAVQQLVVGTT